MQPNRRAPMEGILFTDQYQLTMAQLFFRMGLHETTVLFDHYFRRNPNYDSHQAGYCVNAGLDWLLDWMRDARFGSTEIDYLRSVETATGDRLFADDFLAWLAANGDFSGISLRAIPEGRVVHPNTPLTNVQGPLAMAQILETPLLAHLNYQTLIATKASRISDSAHPRVWTTPRPRTRRQCRRACRTHRRRPLHLQRGRLAPLQPRAQRYARA